ncbi:hypothetical protein [Cupriavidus sp. L7L]|uniref:hypothetical protein n=1 Tax=Cupriavidus sp. L7L TaxID=2546443 RepID=UPI001FB75482|nr:hypothetical protein [Cupriavidus sp. L7L]
MPRTINASDQNPTKPARQSDYFRPSSPAKAAHRAHVDKGLDSPARDALVKQTMAGIRRILGTRQRQAKALVKDDLLEMLVMVDQRKPMQAARDRALLLVGFAGAALRIGSHPL